MRQKLGQHFLKNPAVLRKIAEAADFEPGEAVIEIGPGHGELTQEIAARGGRQGARLVLIERDPLLIPALQEKFPTAQVIEGDVLEVLPDLTRALRPAPYVLLGNIPYYLSGFLFRTIGNLEHKPRRTIFTIQKEVAERIAAEPPHMNRLAAAVRMWSDPRIIGLISRKDFSPPPDVDSATILLEARADAPQGAVLENLDRALTILFKQPRKTILNNVVEGTKLPRDEAASLLQKAGVGPDLRPQNLSIGDIHALSSLLPTTLDN